MTDLNDLKDPSVTATEAEILVFAIERSRKQFIWKCGGLDAAGLSHRHPPTEMTLGGLIKHVALIEDHYGNARVGTSPMPEPWRAIDWDADPSWEWRTGATDDPAELYALWHAAVERSRAGIAEALAGGGPDAPVKIADNWSPNLRRVLMDLHDEYARHVGHADLLRESFDGLVGEDPPR